MEIPADIADRYPFLLGYLADTEGGSSGSPVFLRDGTGVIGINHSSWFNNDFKPIFNGGSLMSYIVPQIEQYLPSGAAPDLVVESARVDKEFLRPGESFTLSLTVRNQGTASSSTPLRYYYSTDDTISTADAPVGTDTVDVLAADETIEKSITLTAPDYVGTYYYGACVDPAANETATYNNCSAAVWINVSDEPPFWMYWVSNNDIQRATNDGTNRQNINISDQGTGIVSIALDVEGGKMYWTLWAGTDRCKIQRANLDGSNVEDIVTGLAEPAAIALDTAGEKMYWTDTYNSEIQRANLDGSNVEDIVVGLNSPHGIALDVAAEKMYWTNYGEDLIQRANLDGSNVEDIVSGLHIPMGIALDVAAEKMYWVDQGRDNRSGNMSIGKIQRANLNGSNLEDLVEGLRAPYGIALDVEGAKIYWTDSRSNKIQRANLDGSNVEDLITGINVSGGIALGISQRGGPSPPPATISFNPGTVADQTFTVDTLITPLVLPVATGGTPPYTYTLSPVPTGLAFTAATRSLSGTPTTTGKTDVTYTATDNTSNSATLTFKIEVIGDDPGPLDVNGDGRVTAMDLVAVALFYGTSVPAGISLPADVNADGVVNILDLTAVAQGIDAAGGGIQGLSLAEVEAALLAAIEQATDIEAIAEAPIGNSTSQHVLSAGVYSNVAAALADARHFATSDARAVLEGLLQLLAELGTIPSETTLLPNYPNPFNPETWIPYHLAQDAAVVLTIYDVRGSTVRELVLGHQPAGIYQSKHRAAYWDGRNESGESVASGLYFYTLTAGEFTATRRLLVIK